MSDNTFDTIHDVVLIGGGIMSATLGAMMSRLEPDASVALLERLDEIAGESSGAWNNAGTGHSGYAELNYMPDATDGATAQDIARRFRLSRRFWSSLAADDTMPEFLTPAPHMDIVFGERDVEYLCTRVDTMRTSPTFSDMEFTEDPETIREWAPLLVEGRTHTGPMAASRHHAGTDVDFGALTRWLVDDIATRGTDVRLHHEVTRLHRRDDGLWVITGRDRTGGQRFRLTSRFVFVGAGGYALELLQKAQVEEVRGYAVFPVGAQFFRTDNPVVVARHDAKVYGRADVGAPPMSVPHLDLRVVDGTRSLMFGPYATFSTRLLRHGRLSDLFRTIRLRNAAVMATAGVRNLALVRYLLGQLASSRKRKFAQLLRFYPGADPADWYLMQAGQRAQLIKPDEHGHGVLTFGTELVTSADGTIAGLLGASPGASIAPAVMVDLLTRCFPDRQDAWASTLGNWMPNRSHDAA
ncbi:malate dehydrogenase (quinone) [Rhodococcus artemisiae]|uniref:Probable malate:quinone oxidoreductase n=1 Tax=Rhodococcus artemisiae TaxID=714159 RepID=A0ABU7L3Y2_9NOCA|nr:malate dehydrogenase (quinone) [Rhodococcus artemisiae]MEE2056265.1 malate dehydrogenase (quinone) [Rhodococcus artemisiae]